MAKTDNLSDFLTDVANAIRTKKGTTGTINAQNFSSEIASIETDNPYIATTTTEMAQYLTSKYDGAIVRYTGTTGTYTQNMLYKVKAVSANEWAFDELITPVGSTTKTENGTYNVKEYAEVVVNVPIGITPTGKKEITDTNEVDVTNFATAQVVDSNLVASNIKKDTTILGVTGTLETGITPTGSIDITSNGTVDVTNYASANVNVANQNPYTAANATEMAQYLASKYYGVVVKYTGTTGTYTQNRLYKVIQVTSNEYTFEELITPVGSTTKTENGTYDVKEYAEVVVNVPSGGNTLKNLLDATKTAKYLFSGYQGKWINTLIQPNDTENVTNMNYMFNYCTNLTITPLFNTSNVTDMSYMFYTCRALTEIPQLDTSNVTDMNHMFYNCEALTTIPQLNTSNNINMVGMFQNCSALTTIPQLDASKVTNMGSMFFSCSALTTIPLLDTSKVRDMSRMFYGCANLTTVPAINANSVTNASNLENMFYGCSNLKSILMTNIGVNLNISASTKFEREDLLVILNNLKTVTSTKTLTMGASNLAKLTDEDKAIATNKGWTLA